jgi:broad specificity phosphatase PhoE
MWTTVYGKEDWWTKFADCSPAFTGSSRKLPMLEMATERIAGAIEKIKRKHQGKRIGFVVPEPMASIVRCQLVGGSIEDMWKAETDTGNWDLLIVDPKAETVAEVNTAVAFT